MAEGKNGLDALTSLLGRMPDGQMTAKEQETLARMLQEKPDLISKLAEALTSDSLDEPTPAQQEEKEAYMRQLENEGKVPKKQVLVRPKAGFVVKTFKLVMEGEEEGGGEEMKRVEEVEEKTKVFINIVTSDMLAPISAAAAAASAPGGGGGRAGRMYEIPHVVGPARKEKDKGGASVPTIDFCVHPHAVRLALSSYSRGGGGGGGGGGEREGGREGGGAGFKDLLVQLAMESARKLWQAEEDREGGREGGKTTRRRRRRRVYVDPVYIILKGCSYKTGKEVLTLIVDRRALASHPPSLPPSKTTTLPPMVLPQPKNDAIAAAAATATTTTAAATAAEEEKARAVKHLRRRMGKKVVIGDEDEEEEETKQAPPVPPLSPTSTDQKCAPSPSTSPPSLPPSPSSLSSFQIYPLDFQIIEQGGRGGREGGREGVDLAAVMVMDAPDSRFRARSTRPHSLLVKVVLPEGGREGGREGGWVEEEWSVGVAEKELLVESRVFEEGEGGREGGKEGGRKYVQMVKLPYPLQIEEEEGEEGREEGVMAARMVVEEGREGGVARRVLVVRLLVEKGEDKVVQFAKPVVVKEEGGREEGREGGVEEEKEGGKEEKEGGGGGGGKDHERWVAPAPVGGGSIAGLSKRGEGERKEREEGEEEEGHDSILPARKEIEARNGGQSQQQQQQQEEELARQPDYDLTEEETSFFLFFPVPGIDRESVQVSTGDDAVNISFSSSSASSLSTCWSLSLPLPKPLDSTSTARCRWQVSSENLWVSVPKKAMGKKEKGVLLTSPHIFTMCE